MALKREPDNDHRFQVASAAPLTSTLPARRPSTHVQSAKPRGAIIVIVTRRAGPLAVADKILVVANGQAVHFGPLALWPATFW